MDSSPFPDDEAVPAQGEEAAPPRKRGRLRILLISVLAVLLVGGGVAAAGGYFGWYGGGGTHPYDVMPASMVAYVQLDLNPLRGDHPRRLRDHHSEGDGERCPR